MHFSIVLCHACMRPWKHSFEISLRSVVQTASLDSPLELGKEEARSGELGGCSSTARICRDAQDIVNNRVVTVKQSRVVLPQLPPLLAHWMKQTPQYLFVNVLVDRLALWTIPFTSKNGIIMILTLDFDCRAFFSLGNVGLFH